MRLNTLIILAISLIRLKLIFHIKYEQPEYFIFLLHIIMDTTTLYCDIDKDLKKDIMIKEITDKLDQVLAAIPDLHQKRTDMRIISLVSNVIENYINEKKYEVDKKKVILDYLKIKFGLNDLEMKTLEASIEFLVRHKIVKKISTFKTIKKYVTSAIKKRLSTN